MPARIAPDRLREFVDLIIASLDEDADGPTLAGKAFLSRFHFDRLVAAGLGESPTAFRRRLLLERAAWRLTRPAAAMSDIASEAGYDTADGFARAFTRAFGSPPSQYRRRPDPFQIPAANGVHFHPPGGLSLAGSTSGAPVMDPIDHIFEHDLRHTRHLIEKASALDASDLDRPVWDSWESLPFDAEDGTIRAMLARLVTTKENWVASLAGTEPADGSDTTLDGLARRLEAAGPDLLDRVRQIRKRGNWEDGFVDALCDPPQSFTYRWVVEHLITFSAYRRQTLVKALHHLGVADLDMASPHD